MALSRFERKCLKIHWSVSSSFVPLTQPALAAFTGSVPRHGCVIGFLSKFTWWRRQEERLFVAIPGAISTEPSQTVNQQIFPCAMPADALAIQNGTDRTVHSLFKPKWDGFGRAP